MKKSVAPSLLTILHSLLALTTRHPTLSLQQITKTLSAKGLPLLILFVSLPSCFPIQIPGLSTPFGLCLAFLSFSYLLSKRLWLPRWLLKKTLPSHSVKTLIKKTIKVTLWAKKFLRPRLLFLSTHPLFHALNGILIFLLALILALPLPIPLTNLLSAIPIFLLSLGLLEDDGIVLLVGYALSLGCFAAFTSLFLLGLHVVH
jgi:hypothetical protein